MAQPRHPDPSTFDLIGRVLTDIRTLVRQELALVRAEIREEASRVVVASGLAAAGLAALTVGGLWLLVGVTRGIAALFEWPLGGVYAGIGAVLLLTALVILAVAWQQLHGLRVLPKTRETLHQQAHWAEQHAHEGA
jgi:hypothetical protein